ncbi:hypothetical protein [Priestia taiwanensis]|uniref:Uncharacterized protein n=1 Tax=Priestia taiwanensis TaxID=1347902 RepID=A0A917AQP8_9BACI|nr:hypothetical protein [Priestia taiwanensis]MBM7363210.1 hypothetical protein [Priestia taiwanensis]GGE68570.1 hypothetical protein GCM10007140_18290 [Priestia taiwanensis]
MQKLSTLSATKWLVEETEKIDFDNWTGCRVSNLVPRRYSHYCKIIHPIHHDKTIVDENLLWSDLDPLEGVIIELGERIRLKDLATKYNLHYTKEISIDSLIHLFNSSPRYLIGGLEGNIDDETIKEIVSVLQPFTKTGNCYFHYEMLKVPKYYEEQLYYGKLTDALDLSHDDHAEGSPSWWWEENKHWCLATEYDLSFSLFGGSKEMVDSLLANEFLECIEVDWHTRVDSKADQTNMKKG